MAFRNFNNLIVENDLVIGNTLFLPSIGNENSLVTINGDGQISLTHTMDLEVTGNNTITIGNLLCDGTELFSSNGNIIGNNVIVDGYAQCSEFKCSNIITERLIVSGEELLQYTNIPITTNLSSVRDLEGIDAVVFNPLQGETITQKAPNLIVNGGVQTAISSNGLLIVVLQNQEAIVYEWNDGWEQLGSPLPVTSDYNDNVDQFAVAISNSYRLFTHAIRPNDDNGRVYEWDGSTWVQIGNAFATQIGRHIYDHYNSLITIGISDDGEMLMHNNVITGGVSLYRYVASNNSWNKFQNPFPDGYFSSYSTSAALSSDNSILVCGLVTNYGASNTQIKTFKYNTITELFDEIYTGTSIIGAGNWLGLTLAVTSDGNGLIAEGTGFAQVYYRDEINGWITKGSPIVDSRIGAYAVDAQQTPADTAPYPRTICTILSNIDYVSFAFKKDSCDVYKWNGTSWEIFAQSLGLDIAPRVVVCADDYSLVITGTEGVSTYQLGISTVTLKLPNASENAGKQYKFSKEPGAIIKSLALNITRSLNDAPTTLILQDSERFSVLQSDGNTWVTTINF